MFYIQISTIKCTSLCIFISWIHLNKKNHTSHEKVKKNLKFKKALHTLIERHSGRQANWSKNLKLLWLILLALLFTWPIWLYRCNVIGIHQVKYEYEWNLEHYTAFYTVFYLNVFRSIGQVGKMEFDEIGQRVNFP